MRLWGTEILSTLHNNLLLSHFQAHNPKGWNPVSVASTHNGDYIPSFRSPHIIPRILINTINILQAKWIATQPGECEEKKIFPRHPTQKTFVNTVCKVLAQPVLLKTETIYISSIIALMSIFWSFIILIFYATLYSAVKFLIKLDKLNYIVL